MFAGCREAEFFATLPWPLRAELQQHTLQLRWMDDVVHIWRDALSRGGKRVFRRLGAATDSPLRVPPQTSKRNQV